MSLFRKVLFWTHLTVGVIGGLVILIMSATGVLLMYEKQITAWADTRNFQVTPSVAGAARLPVEELLAKVRESQAGASIISVTVRAGASEPAAVALAAAPGGGPGAARTIFVNPYTGDVLGEGAKGVREFFHVMTDWHRWLGAEGASRTTARAITGACNLGFLFIVISGLYLWFPRKWTKPQFKNILWFKRGLPGKARDFNWHNVIGFWSFVPLFIVVLSATVISYPWASNLVYKLVGETPPAPAPPGAQSTWLRAPRAEQAPANTDPRRAVVVVAASFQPPASAVLFIRPPRDLSGQNVDPRRMVQVWRVPFAPPGAQVVWSRGGRVSENGYASPFGRYVFVIAADVAAEIPALGRAFAVAADAPADIPAAGRAFRVAADAASEQL